MKNFTAVPDSDDEEDDEPDAQVLGSSQPPALDTQPLDFPNQTLGVGGTAKAATFYSASKVAIDELGQRGEDTTTVASLAALKGAESLPVTIASSDSTSSISMAAMEPPSKKHVAPQPHASIEQSIQRTEPQEATELAYSPTDVQARAMPRTTLTTEESSQATDTPSSPPQLMRRESYAAKKRQSPPASFIVPEALQSKVVLMAELRAMKIVSPPMLPSQPCPSTAFAGPSFCLPLLYPKSSPFIGSISAFPCLFITGYWTDICVLRHL